jgi:hypothetical protein
MIGALRTEGERWGKFYLCSMKLCIYGHQRMCLFCQYVLVVSLFILPLLVMCFLLYIFGVLKSALCFKK